MYLEDFKDADHDAVRLVLIGGGRPASCVGPVHTFRSVPASGLRTRWDKEGDGLIADYNKDMKKKEKGKKPPPIADVPALPDAVSDDSDESADTP